MVDTTNPTARVGPLLLCTRYPGLLRIFYVSVSYFYSWYSWLPKRLNRGPPADTNGIMNLQGHVKIIIDKRYRKRTQFVANPYRYLDLAMSIPHRNKIRCIFFP